MSALKLEKTKLVKVDKVELISLVDNSADFISSINAREAESFRQWTKKRYGEYWTRTHSELPFAEHGFSMLIRILNGKKTASILFDTGVSSGGVVENAKRMGLELDEVEYIVLSHGHYDHFGGLVSVLKVINKTDILLITHEDMFKNRGTTNSDGTIREYPRFPDIKQLSSAKIINTKQPSLFADDMILVTGEIPRETSFERGYQRHVTFDSQSWNPDPLILDDRALVINVKKKGLVIVSGCAHAGIINTIQYSQKITGVTDVYAVMGGFHLAGKGNERRIKQTVKELKNINPKRIIPSHCTGWRGIYTIASSLPHAFMWGSVGNLYEF